MFLLFLSSSPLHAYEVIQAKDVKAYEKNNLKVFNKALTQNEQNREGIHIKSPIDVINERKEKNIAPPKEPDQIEFTSDVMEYKNDTNEVLANGNVVIKTSPEKTKITATRGVFDRNQNIIKLFDNVRLYKDGGVIVGDYMVIDLNSENALLDEPIGEYADFKFKGKEMHAISNRIEAINGDIELANKVETRVFSSGFGGAINYDFMVQGDDRPTKQILNEHSEPFKIKTQEIVIKALKDHDEVVLNGADIYFKKFKLMSAQNVQLYTDKEQEYVETNLPEIGSFPDFGTFFGPGFSFKAPGSSVFKVAPVLVIGDGLGFGGIIKHASKRNKLQAAYASNSQNLIVRGTYKFNKKLRLDYARHAYMNDGIFGDNRPGYMAQLVWEDSWYNKDLDFKYSQWLSGGYVSDYYKDNQEDHSGTMRLRYQGAINRSLFRIENPENNFDFDFGMRVDGAATIYGTGEVTAFARVGPTITNHFKAWGSRIFFNIAGIHGHSPYLFDDFRYGKVNIFFDETFRLCKYFSLGFRGSISPLKDNYDNKWLTEGRFYALFGPEDLKLAVGYDTVREMATFDVLLILGGDKTKIDYDKMVIENPNKLKKKNTLKEELELRRMEVPKDETEAI